MNQTPVRIFVLWHPEYADGLRIAQGVFDWFRTPDGHGIQVHYRSEADPRRNDGLPAPMPLDRAMVNLVVLLAESKMVRDRVWREWLTLLADKDTVDQECKRGGSTKKAGFVQIYPVALQSTAYKLPGPLRKLNFIAPHPGTGRGGEDAPADLDALLRSLRTQLTEALARILGHTLEEMHSPGRFLKGLFGALLGAFSSKLQQTADEPAKVKVFLSHAKRDGTPVAKALRDYVYQKTQLSAFFDENDIALGFKFAEVLERSVRTETVAMVSVNSDCYSSRPWCRREVQLFSHPKQSKQGVWERPPLLVVQSMNGGHVASAIPEYGNAPVLRWREGDEALCIDTLLREVIFRTYHSYVASHIKESLGASPDSNRIFVNWPPDPLGLDTVIRGWERHRLEIWNKEAKKAAEGKKRRPPRPKLRPLEVIYPGRGMSSIELEALTERYPQVRLLSYNEARPFP